MSERTGDAHAENDVPLGAAKGKAISQNEDVRSPLRGAFFTRSGSMRAKFRFKIEQSIVHGGLPISHLGFFVLSSDLAARRSEALESPKGYRPPFKF